MTGTQYILPDGRIGTEIARKGAKVVVLAVNPKWPHESRQEQHSPTDLQRIDHDAAYEEARW